VKEIDGRRLRPSLESGLKMQKEGAGEVHNIASEGQMRVRVEVEETKPKRKSRRIVWGCNHSRLFRTPLFLHPSKS